MLVQPVLALLNDGVAAEHLSAHGLIREWRGSLLAQIQLLRSHHKSISLHNDCLSKTIVRALFTDLEPHEHVAGIILKFADLFIDKFHLREWHRIE